MTTLMDYFANPIAGEWGDEAEDSTDGVPVLRTTNFTADGRLSYNDLTFRAIDTQKKEDKILKPGDIIIEKSGGTPKKPVGRCVYFDRDDDYDYFCSNFTAVLRADTKEVNTKYLWYILQEHYKTRQCLKYQYKTNGISNLDITNYLSHIEIDLPSREVQDKRVDSMDYSQYLLDVHKNLLDIMDNAVKSRFVEMFGDPVTNPMGWELKTVGKVASDVKYGTSEKASDTGQYKYLRMNNLTYDGYIDLSDLKYIDMSDEELEKCVVRRGDILFNRTNSIELVGKTSYFNFDEDMVIAGYIIRVRLKECLSPVFFARFMNLEYMKRKLRSMAKGAVNQANINAQELKSIEVYIPPIELQNQFADFVALTDKSKLTIQKSMDNLTEWRDSLLQEYFG